MYAFIKGAHFLLTIEHTFKFFMARLEPRRAVRRRLQQENVSDIPTRLTIQAFYDRYIEIAQLV